MELVHRLALFPPHGVHSVNAVWNPSSHSMQTLSVQSAQWSGLSRGSHVSPAIPVAMSLSHRTHTGPFLSTVIAACHFGLTTT